MKRAIINNGLMYGTLNGVIMENWKIEEIINSCIDNNTAELIIDTNETKMYLLAIN